MSLKKIVYINKEDIIKPPTGEYHRWISASDLNEIKDVVNNNSDEITLVRSETTLSLNDYVLKTSLDSEIDRIDNNFKLERDTSNDLYLKIPETKTLTLLSLDSVSTEEVVGSNPIPRGTNFIELENKTVIDGNSLGINTIDFGNGTSIKYNIFDFQGSRYIRAITLRGTAYSNNVFTGNITTYRERVLTYNLDTLESDLLTTEVTSGDIFKDDITLETIINNVLANNLNSGNAYEISSTSPTITLEIVRSDDLTTTHTLTLDNTLSLNYGPHMRWDETTNPNEYVIDNVRNAAEGIESLFTNFFNSGGKRYLKLLNVDKIGGTNTQVNNRLNRVSLITDNTTTIEIPLKTLILEKADKAYVDDELAKKADVGSGGGTSTTGYTKTEADDKFLDYTLMGLEKVVTNSDLSLRTTDIPNRGSAFYNFVVNTNGISVVLANGSLGTPFIATTDFHVITRKAMVDYVTSELEDLKTDIFSVTFDRNNSSSTTTRWESNNKNTGIDIVDYETIEYLGTETLTSTLSGSSSNPTTLYSFGTGSAQGGATTNLTGYKINTTLYLKYIQTNSQGVTQDTTQTLDIKLIEA